MPWAKKGLNTVATDCADCAVGKFNAFYHRDACDTATTCTDGTLSAGWDAATRSWTCTPCDAGKYMTKVAHDLALLVGTCAVKVGGANTDCAAATANTAACETTATASGGGGVAANACVFTAGALIGGVGTCVACVAGEKPASMHQSTLYTKPSFGKDAKSLAPNNPPKLTVPWGRGNMTKAGGNTTTTLDGTPIIVGAVLGSVFESSTAVTGLMLLVWLAACSSCTLCWYERKSILPEARMRFLMVPFEKRSSNTIGKLTLKRASDDAGCPREACHSIDLRSRQKNGSREGANPFLLMVVIGYRKLSKRVTRRWTRS